jgi:hypothetical protein
MRTRASLVLVVVACTIASAAHAGGPGDVYTDVAQDGKLSCNHSRSDLEAALRSGTLNQYGDPLTLAHMKLEVRKQLDGSCKPRVQGPGATTTPTGTSTTTDSGRSGTSKHAKSKARQRRAPQPPTESGRPIERGGPASGENGSFLAGRGLAVGLLAAAVALGGWLTKHALSARG